MPTLPRLAVARHVTRAFGKELSMNVSLRKKRSKVAEVKRQCYRCNGTGMAPCRICAGSGRVMAGKTFDGKPKFDRCSGCVGRKTGRCPKCQGERFII